ncbi:surface-adhesin E family protein [Acinetobacter sp. YH12144]|uniref:surface-adhesin E family protein n=1 Tax=Acinetobacter sp. YH12144 TaxID=2601128 RepID=UPI0015D3A9AE|nr:surface-adhesin E family protein [Acinetobacter sp. YH12144]
MLRIFCVLISMCASSLVFANDQWQRIGYDSDREFFYEYNINSISQVAEYPYTSNKKVWVRKTVVNDISQDGLSVGDYTMQLMWINCSANTLGLKSIVGYKKTGKVIPNYSNTNSYVQMQDAIPGTMGEAYVDSVCS